MLSLFSTWLNALRSVTFVRFHLVLFAEVSHRYSRCDTNDCHQNQPRGIERMAPAGSHKNHKIDSIYPFLSSTVITGLTCLNFTKCGATRRRDNPISFHVFYHRFLGYLNLVTIQLQASAVTSLHKRQNWLMLILLSSKIAAYMVAEV